MYCGQDWDPIDASEIDVFSLDFRNDVVAGETITQVVQWTIGVNLGTDPAPSARLVGVPGVVGTIVSQMFTTGQPGVTYWMAALVRTSAGRQIELWSHVPCVNPM